MTGLTVDDVKILQKKARKQIKEILNTVFPLPAKTTARGGDYMRDLIFTFGEDIHTLIGKANDWPEIADNIVKAFAAHGMIAKPYSAIWTRKGTLYSRPRLTLAVDVNKKLEDLYFLVQDNQYFDSNHTLPKGTSSLVKKVNGYL